MAEFRTAPGGYVSPVEGTIADNSSGTFGAARDGGSRKHAGNDFQTPAGSPALAVVGGKVIYVGDNQGYRHNAVVLGDDGNAYRYATHKSIDVKLGQRVAQGQKIGTVGGLNGGRPHLHFEVIPPTSPAFRKMVANPGQFVSTQWFPGGQPLTTDPAKVLGVNYGDRLIAGAILPNPDPFGVDRFNKQAGSLAGLTTGQELTDAYFSRAANALPATATSYAPLPHLRPAQQAIAASFPAPPLPHLRPAGVVPSFSSAKMAGAAGGPRAAQKPVLASALPTPPLNVGPSIPVGPLGADKIIRAVIANDPVALKAAMDETGEQIKRASSGKTAEESFQVITGLQTYFEKLQGTPIAGQAAAAIKANPKLMEGVPALAKPLISKALKAAPAVATTAVAKPKAPLFPSVAATGNTYPSLPRPIAATGNTIPSQPRPIAATGNTYPSIPRPVAAGTPTAGYEVNRASPQSYYQMATGNRRSPHVAAPPPAMTVPPYYSQTSVDPTPPSYYSMATGNQRSPPTAKPFGPGVSFPSGLGMAPRQTPSPAVLALVQSLAQNPNQFGTFLRALGSGPGMSNNAPTISRIRTIAPYAPTGPGQPRVTGGAPGPYYGSSSGTAIGPTWSGTSPTPSGGPNYNATISPNGKTVSWTNTNGQTFTAQRFGF